MKQDDVAAARASALDFFRIFKLSRSTFVNLDNLEEQYITLQHNHQHDENFLLSLNKGYEILRSEVLRVEYLLKISKIEIEAHNNPDDLEEFLDLQEQIELNRENSSSLELIKYNLIIRKKDILLELDRFIPMRDIKNISRNFANLKFIDRLQKNLKNILEKLPQL